jgi:hypothetical protein
MLAFRSQQSNHCAREEFLYELNAGPAGGRLRRPSSAGSDTSATGRRPHRPPGTLGTMTVPALTPRGFWIRVVVFGASLLLYLGGMVYMAQEHSVIGVAAFAFLALFSLTGLIVIVLVRTGRFPAASGDLAATPPDPMDDRVLQGLEPEWRLAFGERLDDAAQARIRRAVRNGRSVTDPDEAAVAVGLARREGHRARIYGLLLPPTLIAIAAVWVLVGVGWFWVAVPLVLAGVVPFVLRWRYQVARRAGEANQRVARRSR